MVEAHVRDLVANAPVRATADERRGFSGLRKWVESPEFHLHHLGVNCVLREDEESRRPQLAFQLTVRHRPPEVDRAVAAISRVLGRTKAIAA